MFNNERKNRKALIAVVLCGFFLMGLLSAYFYRTPILKFFYRDFKASVPNVYSAWESAFNPIAEGDIYVSKNGSDTNDGTKERPFLTVKRALQAVETIDRTNQSEIVVCIEGGTYSIDSLHLLEEHGGSEECRVVYSSYGEGEVVLNAGISLSPEDFVKSQEYPALSSRLSKTAKENVYVLDVTQAPYYLSQEDWGKLYPIGTYNTADRYQGETIGPMYSELFINGTRQALSRYPNDGYIYTDEVVLEGKTLGNKPNGEPFGDIFTVEKALGERMRSWSNLEDVWAYGYWQYDWADGSTPIRYDARARGGVLKETWFSGDVETLWNTLYNSPWKSEIWQSAFPQYKTVGRY